MTRSLSNADAGARMFATVKRYDPAKAYGVLAPDDGSPDIYCRAEALAAVGLDTLLAGTTVDCETVQGRRGPEVSRILAVDFSTASPRRGFFARAPGNGPMADRPGIGRADGADADSRITALVKWFMPSKGYGFLEPGDGSPDVFCHLGAVEASGRDTLPRGGVVTCEIVPGDRHERTARAAICIGGGGSPDRRRSLPAGFANRVLGKLIDIARKTQGRALTTMSLTTV